MKIGDRVMVIEDSFYAEIGDIGKITNIELADENSDDTRAWIAGILSYEVPVDLRTVRLLTPLELSML